MENINDNLISVCKVDELPSGQSKCIKLEGKEIGLFNVNGKYYALNNVCIHAGGTLHDGPLNCDKAQISCSWHAWTFDLATGKCVSHPKQDVFAKTYPVKIVNNEIFIDIASI